jgi:hypothetical protein
MPPLPRRSLPAVVRVEGRVLKDVCGADRAIAYTLLARSSQVVRSAGTVLLIVRFLTMTEHYYALLTIDRKLSAKMWGLKGVALTYFLCSSLISLLVSTVIFQGERGAWGADLC